MLIAAMIGIDKRATMDIDITTLVMQSPQKRYYSAIKRFL